MSFYKWRREAAFLSLRGRSRAHQQRQVVSAWLQAHRRRKALRKLSGVRRNWEAFQRRRALRVWRARAMQAQERSIQIEYGLQKLATVCDYSWQKLQRRFVAVVVVWWW
jgi:hypothetical protein